MLVTIAIVVAALLVLAPVLEICFVFCYTVAALIALKIWMPKSMAVVARVLFYVGVVADAAYQQTYGRFWFGEWLGWPWKLPGGWMFSGRVQYHIDNAPAGENLDRAIRWAQLLNSVAPNHIKRLDAALVRQAAALEPVVDTHL